MKGTSVSQATTHPDWSRSYLLIGNPQRAGSLLTPRFYQ